MKITFSRVRAFTLIELLIVIAIIGLLTGIILSNLQTPKAKARDAKRISDIGNIQLALELFFDRCKQYPSSISGIPGNISVSTCPDGINLGTFISTIPTTPTGAAYGYSYLTDYSAGSPGVITDYVLHEQLEYYNEAMKDGLSPMPIAPLGSTWSTNFTCGTSVSGGNTTYHYCRTSK